MILLDTHLVLWAALWPDRLPPRAAKLMRSRAEPVGFSVGTLWEVALKASLGRADFDVDARQLRRWLLGEAFSEVPIAPEHVLRVADLPSVHRDPFDRLLVAQAQAEQMTLWTVDETLAGYGKAVRVV